MRIQIINVAQKLPAWADTACEEYMQRMPREISLQTTTLPLAARRSGQTAVAAREQEAQMILKRFSAGDLNLALDERGKCWSSRDWAEKLESWMLEHPRVNIVIGGPDGLAPSCLEACRERIALGRMTMPHALVRVVLAEQLYRAWTIIKGHPYHRE
jgi:23S rRNA (pseudouridine1915-N3)-methyltransferase